MSRRGLAQGPTCPPGLIQVPQGQAVARTAESSMARAAGTVAGALKKVVGDLWAHIVSVNDLIPEAAQLDMLRFEATIGSSTLTQPDPVKVPNGYAFDLYGVMGYIEEPGLNVSNFPLITWNVQEVGRRNVFGTDQSMAQLLTIFGPTPPIVFPRSLYLFSPGADVKLTFARASGWAGADKKVGVVLLGGLVAPDRLEK